MNTTMKILLTLVVGIATGVLVTNWWCHRDHQADSSVSEGGDHFDKVMADLDKFDRTLVNPNQDTAIQRKGLRLMEKLGVGPMPYECQDKPTKLVSAEEAQDLIERYRNSPLQLFTHVGSQMENLRGWYIEKDSIQKVFERNPLANGLQLYLGRKDVPGYDPLTIVWVPRRRIKADYCSEWEKSGRGSLFHKVADTGGDTIWWRDSHDYLKPCPPDCPPR